MRRGEVKAICIGSKSRLDLKSLARNHWQGHAASRCRPGPLHTELHGLWGLPGFVGLWMSVARQVSPASFQGVCSKKHVNVHLSFDPIRMSSLQISFERRPTLLHAS